MKNKWLGFVACIIGCPVVWAIIDYIKSMINGEPFQFKILGNLVTPLLVGAVMGYFSFIRKKNEK